MELFLGVEANTDSDWNEGAESVVHSRGQRDPFVLGFGGRLGRRKMAHPTLFERVTFAIGGLRTSGVPTPGYEVCLVRQFHARSGEQ